MEEMEASWSHILFQDIYEGGGEEGSKAGEDTNVLNLAGGLNFFNDISYLSIICMARRCWPAGSWFALNFILVP